MFSTDKILKLTKSLLPKGRAFRVPQGGVMENLFRGLAISESIFLNDSISTYDAVIPDSAKFTIEDAEMWEKKLGIKAAPSTPLATRMAVIRQRYNYPSTDAPRQHYTFIQDQLRSAGFDVYVHENPSGTPPDELLFTMHGTDVYHGSDTMMGGAYSEFVANHLEEDLDREFNIGSNYYSTFFIGGSTVPNFADVPEDRKEEFRHLILLLKPTQTVAILFVNYT